MNEPSIRDRWHRSTYAEVDLKKLKTNFQRFRDLMPRGAFICPMVKAEAYGHGSLRVARALREAGATHLGVALIEEALRLREDGDTGDILVFGVLEGRSADVVVEYGLTPVVSESTALRKLERAVSARGRASKRALKIHFKFNTGMNRLGFDASEAKNLRNWIDRHEEFRLEGVCTHMLRGDDAGRANGDSASQLATFESIFREFEGTGALPHVANSSASVNLAALHRSGKLPAALGSVGSRPGIGIYGGEVLVDLDGQDLAVEPILAWRSRLTMVHRLGAGEKISYNATFVTDRPSVIGVVPVGYGDGYMRCLSNRAEVLCRGQRCRQVGTVCMDYVMIDLTNLETDGKQVEAGEVVHLIGSQGSESITAREVANWANTISYEILTRISERVPRVYID